MSVPPATQFTNLREATAEDCHQMTKAFAHAASPQNLTARAIALLKAQQGVLPPKTHRLDWNQDDDDAQSKSSHSVGGVVDPAFEQDPTMCFAQPIDLYQHGLQAATRAMRDGCDEEMIVCCLLHDIGELYCPSNHGDVAAGILKPYVSEKRWWILAHHEVFQGYYYFHFNGGDREKRQIYKDSPHYQDCVDFCEKYDQASFDPKYDNLPLETFIPMVERIFAKTPFWHNPEHPKASAVTGGR